MIKGVQFFIAARLFVIALPFFLVACVSQEQLAQRYPEAGSSDAQLFFSRCSVCHSAPHPKRHTETEWVFYVDLMQQHMENKNIPLLTDLEKQTLLEYLKRNARL